MDPFAELRLHASSSHPQKAKLNVVLQVITEVVRERRQHMQNANMTAAISSTEYFAALMTALDSQDNSHSHEVLMLLSMVLPTVPEAVLRLKFQMVADCLIKILQKEDEETAPLKAALNCLGLLLIAQETSAQVWSRPGTLKVFHAMMTFSTDTRPKVRKVAQAAAVNLLQHHRECECKALSSHLSNFTSKVLKSCTVSDETKILQLTGFLKSALPLLTGAASAAIIKDLFKLLDLEKKTVSLVAMQAVDASVNHPESVMTKACCESVVEKMLKTDFSIHDADISILCIRTLTATFVRLHAHDNAAAEACAARVFANTCDYFKATDQSVLKATTKSFLAIVELCLSEDKLSRNDKSIHLVADQMIRSIESLLVLRFQHAWSVILPAVAKVFLQFKAFANPKLENILATLVGLYEALNNMPRASRDTEQWLSEAMGAAVVAMGAEKFLELVPLTEKNSNLVPESRSWLLPILRDNIKQSRALLKTFSGKILKYACASEEESKKEGISPLVEKQCKMRVLQLWLLFPSFCAQPSDIGTDLKRIAQLLGNALCDKRYPELQLTVCQGLQALIQYATGQPGDVATKADDIKALTKYSKRYLPILISLLEEIDSETESERCTALVDTIAAFANIAEKEFMKSMFQKLLQKLLEASTQSQQSGVAAEALKKAKAISHLHMSAAQAFIGAVDQESISLMYRVIKPYLLDDTDTVMQKRAYSVLVAICRHHPKFTCDPEILKDLVDSLCDSLMTCSIPAKKMRLRCLSHIITTMQELGETNTDLIPPLVGEIMLCTKEANGKAREAAFELLVAMAKLTASARENGLMEFFQMIFGGLAGQTPHMRSAAVVALCRLVFEFGRTEPAVAQAMPDFLQTILLLLHEKAREVIKSVIAFLKLSIAIIPQDELKQYLPDMMNGLMTWIGDSKNRFRAKIRIILIKLCRKYGYDYVMSLVPEADRKWIIHIKKEKSRLDKKKEQGKQARKDNAFEKFLNDEDEDSEDEEEQVDAPAAQTASKPGAARRSYIKEDVDNDEIVDFLDKSLIKNIVSKKPRKQKAKAGEDDFDTSKDGRIIIPDDDEPQGMDVAQDDDEETLRKDVKKQLQEMQLNKSSQDTKRKRSAVASGSEYKSKKAGGDMKRKGKLEPFAYIPLDPKNMAKRNQRSGVENYSKIGKSKEKSRQPRNGSGPSSKRRRKF